MAIGLKIFALIAVTTYMLQAGLATSSSELATVARRKAELARALVLMLVLGPLAARVLAAVFALSPRPAVALVLLSLVGVVPLASRGARGARGDVTSALVVTVVLGVVAAFTAAPTARLLLSYRGPLEVPTGALLVQVLLLQGVPLAAGILVRSKTKRALGLERVLRVFNVAVLVLLLAGAVVVMPRYGAVRSLGWSGALAACVFAVFIALTGYLLGGSDPAERRTLAGLANMPNIMLAVAIVTSAGVDAGFVIAIVGVFTVRFFTGVAIQRVLARSAQRGDRSSIRAPTV